MHCRNAITNAPPPPPPKITILNPALIRGLFEGLDRDEELNFLIDMLVENRHDQNYLSSIIKENKH